MQLPRAFLSLLVLIGSTNALVPVSAGMRSFGSVIKGGELAANFEKVKP